MSGVWDLGEDSRSSYCGVCSFCLESSTGFVATRQNSPAKRKPRVLRKNQTNRRRKPLPIRPLPNTSSHISTCSIAPANNPSPRGELARSLSMAERAIGDILATGDRDFLVRNSGEQVKPPPVLCLCVPPSATPDSLIGAVRGRIVAPLLVASSFFF